MAETKKPTTKGADLSGLDSFADLMGGGGPKQGGGAGSSGIQTAPLDAFIEDEENARVEFDQKGLEQLADSMREPNPHTGEPRGILEPLSVRSHPEKEGVWIINAGHRRIRAARIAGLEEAPFYVQDEADSYHKFISNEQRENLSPLEIATFIRTRLDQGEKKGAIAKALGKPSDYVSNHAVFFDLAPAVRDLYDEGYCRSMRSLSELHRLWKKHPEKIDEYCAGVDQDLTMAQIKALGDSLKSAQKDVSPEPNPEGQSEEPAPVPGDGGGEVAEQTGEPGEIGEPGGSDGPEPMESGEAEPDPSKLKKAIIEIKHDDRAARLMLGQRPTWIGGGWIKYEDDGHEVEVDLLEIQVTRLLEG
ncbi:ParB/RepB/Spo0J family partition protein (plasmid) [Guyparkeria sp. 1SP6A2]|nr:ParB/RepB/Spo0J family partition protein [Guyparkeria sp. 1SP6A2]